jgi:hypothetical protein
LKTHLQTTICRLLKAKATGDKHAALAQLVAHTVLT